MTLDESPPENQSSVTLSLTQLKNVLLDAMLAVDGLESYYRDPEPEVEVEGTTLVLALGVDTHHPVSLDLPTLIEGLRKANINVE